MSNYRLRGASSQFIGSDNMPATDSGNRTMVTSSGLHQLILKIADNILARFCGLIQKGRPGATEGQRITRRTSVHTSFMRHPIDVVYLDRDGVVTKCVPGLMPWRASFSHSSASTQGIGVAGAAHTSELAHGTIAAMDIRPADRLSHPPWDRAPTTAPRTAPARAARGSAMVEFTVVGPLITMIGLSILQYGMLFFAKNQINHASFMAAREGATNHADISAELALLEEFKTSGSNCCVMQEYIVKTPIPVREGFAGPLTSRSNPNDTYSGGAKQWELLLDRSLKWDDFLKLGKTVEIK